MNEESVTGAAPEPLPEFRLLVAMFDDQDGAVRALERVLAARREKQVAAPAVASVRKDAQSVVEINEPETPTQPEATDLSAGVEAEEAWDPTRE